MTQRLHKNTVGSPLPAGVVSLWTSQAVLTTNRNRNVVKRNAYDVQAPCPPGNHYAYFEK